MALRYHKKTLKNKYTKVYYFGALKIIENKNIMKLICLIFLIFCLLKTGGVSCFDKSKTLLFKAVLPFLVILQHTNVYDDFDKIGTFAVTVFFFISGYGMECKRERRLITYRGLINSLIKLLVPLLVPALIYIFTKSFYFDWNQIKGDLFLKSSIILPFTWYIRTLLFLYIIWTITSKFTNRIDVIIPMVTVITLLCGYLGVIPQYTSPIGFIIGACYRNVENKTMNKMENSLKNAKFLLMVVLVLLTYTSQLAISGFQTIINTVNHALYPLVIVMLVCILLSVNFKSHILNFLASISYDLYICQGITFLLISKICPTNKVLYAFLIIAGTIICATICNRITRHLFQYMPKI